MNQPTREEFDELKQEQKRLREEQEALKKRIEQATEPMKAINVNVASADVVVRLDKLEQELSERSTTWLNTLQEHYTDHTARFDKIETVLSGHSKFFEEHGKRLATMATKDDITSIKATQEQILKLLQQKSGD